MKKILSLLGTITLIGTSTTSLVTCKDKIHEYTKEELDKLKKEHQIDTANQEIKNNLEWIAPQEKPFNSGGDYKYYIIIWRGAKNDNWTIKRYKNIGYSSNNNKINGIISHTKIDKSYSGAYLYRNEFDLATNKTREHATWIEDNGTFFKSVYRWNGEEQKLPNLDIDENDNIKVK